MRGHLNQATTTNFAGEPVAYEPLSFEDSLMIEKGKSTIKDLVSVLMPHIREDSEKIAIINIFVKACHHLCDSLSSGDAEHHMEAFKSLMLAKSLIDHHVYGYNNGFDNFVSRDLDVPLSNMLGTLRCAIGETVFSRQNGVNMISGVFVSAEEALEAAKHL